MLSLGKIAAGPRAARYYTDQVALGREDYYAGEGEAPGRWTGSAATAAGLGGRVEAGQLEGLLAGGGLRRAVREGAVAGFDLTFRAPKSVSVLWGVADAATARQLGAAHDAAVEAALAYVEREACRARRGAGGAVQVRGSGFVAAAFRHRASRAGDPLLHTHVVAGNLTQGPDGRWTALDARHLYRHAKTAGFLYQAELRREIDERLGLSWGPVQRGAADIEGVGRGVVEHFSQRRAEILEHMAAHGGRSATSAQVAAWRRAAPSRRSTLTGCASSGAPAPPSTASTRPPSSESCVPAAGPWASPGPSRPRR
jgi:conjugative relaxase-like TrwC/TraI family protein